MFDSIKRGEQTEKIVCRNLERKYYRFRPARFYGGIGTADTVGCNLLCKFCWAWEIVTRPETAGKFYSPEDVARKLKAISERFGFSQVRLSGNEPTIGRAHLLAVLKNLKDSNLKFILESNGILIGYDSSYAKDLAKFKEFIHVRVSIKGANEDEFSRLTGAEPEAFNLQLQALKNLLRANVPCHPAVMTSFSSEENIKKLRERLASIDKRFADFEEEELLLYGGAKQRLEKAKISYKSAHSPHSISKIV